MEVGNGHMKLSIDSPSDAAKLGAQALKNQLAKDKEEKHDPKLDKTV